ncbi:MAG: hypothetical protein WAW37_17930 [Syntrophobacteraceae bacterium]
MEAVRRKGREVTHHLLPPSPERWYIEPEEAVAANIGEIPAQSGHHCGFGPCQCDHAGFLDQVGLKPFLVAGMRTNEDILSSVRELLRKAGTQAELSQISMRAKDHRSNGSCDHKISTESLMELTVRPFASASHRMMVWLAANDFAAHENILDMDRVWV